jgi:hypothetical protein
MERDARAESYERKGRSWWLPVVDVVVRRYWREEEEIVVLIAVRWR